MDSVSIYPRRVQCPSGASRPLRARLLLIFAATVAVLFLVCLVKPASAHAGSYKIEPVNIDATVTTDGVINVVDTRTMEFSGNSTYVYWDFPMGDNEEGYYVFDSVTEITESGEEIPYTRTYDDRVTSNFSNVREPHTYYVKETGLEPEDLEDRDHFNPDSKLYLFFDETDTTSQFRITYHAVDMVDSHADVAEMYWQYIAANHNVVFRDVTVTVHLPVLSGDRAITSGPDTNVYGWDQGGIYGSIYTDSDGVLHIYREKIAMGENGQARAVFPNTWLTGKVPSTDKHLEQILDEQDVWARRTSEMRTKSELKETGGGITMLLIDGILLAFGLIAYFRWGQEYTPDYHEKYAREVPSRDHPVILGEAWSWGRIENRYLVAGLEHLTTLGCIALEKLPTEGEDETGDWAIRLVEAPSEELESPIDSVTYDFLSKVAGDEDVFTFSQFSDWCSQHSDEFQAFSDRWHNTIHEAAKRRGFFESTGRSGKRVLLIMGFALLAGSLFICIPFASGYESVYLGVLTVISIICSLIIIICGLRMKRRSEEAADLQVQLLALERWMRDLPMSQLGFSDDVSVDPTDKEAVEQSNDEWKQLLEVSEVFGLSDKLISYLRSDHPEVLSYESVQKMLCWFEPGTLAAGDGRNAVKDTPAHVLTRIISDLGGVEEEGAGFGGGTSLADTPVGMGVAVESE
jgi:hypothetical protein